MYNASKSFFHTQNQFFVKINLNKFYKGVKSQNEKLNLRFFEQNYKIRNVNYWLFEYLLVQINQSIVDHKQLLQTFP
jgi:hypothetical protein